MPQRADIAVVGAGAAGLMAAIWAGRAHASVALLDGARVLGAKILVAGGGRCNVTHDEVDESAYAGSSRNAVRKVLGRFGVPRTVEFFRELGVELKREETGKLFPTTDDARTILNALLAASRDAGVQVIHPWRVGRVERGAEGGFLLHRADADESFAAQRVILATGGQSLPKTGSDGHGYRMAQALGHSVTRTFPALVPLTLPREHFICSLSGLTLPARLEVRSSTGKRITAFTDSTLCTHFGISGPAVLDISRYYAAAVLGAGAPPELVINWLPAETAQSLDTALAGQKNHSPARWLSHRLPERLASALCDHVAIDAALPGHQLTRERRRELAQAVCDLPLPVTGDRGYNFAEVTAGGVPLSEVHLDTMESRVGPGLHLCGEILDVDGRIGGYNFQWAWASGHVAGHAAAALL